MIDFKNAKAWAVESQMTFLDDVKEWQAYLKENPYLEQEMRYSIEDRFKEGVKAIDCFRQGVEYIPRSLIGRSYHYYIGRKLMELLANERKSRVLDYGCGAGNMGLMFAMAGFATNFLEVEGVQTDFLKWRVERHFLKSKVLTEQSQLGEYDLVIFFNVMEHLEQPLEVLKRIHKAIAAGGYLALMCNTTGKGLDVVSQGVYERELMPFIKENFKLLANTDEMVYQKK